MKVIDCVLRREAGLWMSKAERGGWVLSILRWTSQGS